MDQRAMDEWTRRLASAVAAAVREFGRGREGSDPAVALDLGCFPWHGTLELSLLTEAEFEADPGLLNPREAAAWQGYNFGAGLEAWEAAVPLGTEMMATYRMSPAGERSDVVDRFLAAGTSAMEAASVAAAVAELRRAPGFRVIVAHPDGE